MSGLGYTLGAIATAVGGRVLGDVNAMIERVATDSRHIDADPTTLFIALRGPRHDGHDRIPELQSKGVHHFLLQEDRCAEFADAKGIVVEDTLLALQAMAAWHRGHFSIPIIGITGSNGKTIVKEWLFQMLHREENIVRSPGSWNSQVGVPLSVLQMAPEHTLGIFEAGISQPGEMEKLEPMIRPTIGVLTNMGDAHDEGFGGDRTLKMKEKTSLFRHADKVVHAIPATTIKLADSIEQCIIGDHREGVFVNVLRKDVREGSCRIVLEHEGLENEFTIPFDDSASIANAITCIAVCLRLGRPAEWIEERLAQLVPVEMRMRILQGVQGTTLIDDTYSLDRSSLRSALDHLQRAAHGRRTIVVLSDLAESGSDAPALYAEVAMDMHRHGAQEVIGVGPYMMAQRDRFATGARMYADVDALLASEDPKEFAGATVLIKGARRFGLERIIERWQHQVHGTELEVDLEAIRHNLNHYRALLAPGVRTMAMVKAFGYGSGALELARLFEHERVHYLGVAYADEGIELRTHGITMPIMVMNPEPVDMGTLHRFRLEAEVYDQRSLHEAIAAAKQMDDAPPVHIKLDTGMHRLGFAEGQLPLLLEVLRNEPKPKIASILSHLVASEDPAQDAFTRAQLAAFTRMATAIGDVLGYTPLRHVANSAGISRWPRAHLDMVRLGIGLHGIGVDAEETKHLMPTLALRAPIAQIKHLTTGDTVGYNRRGVISGDRTIATLPIGYADGFSRRLGNGVGRVWVNGKAAPIIGNVCMDMCMVDITGIDCAVGDMTTVFDAEHPVTEVAQDMGTITYEVLTSISQRVKRVYVRG